MRLITASNHFFRGLRESALALPRNGEATAALSGAHRNHAPAGTSWRNLWDCYDQCGAGRPIA
jgi:hypothetical protein